MVGMDRILDMGWPSARDLMRAARSASEDYERCERQLLALRARAESLGGGQAGATSGTHPHDSLERRVVALADRERDLEQRKTRDERVMDAACEMLFGGEDTEWREGLSSLVPAFWCDGLWWHYLQRETWAQVSDRLGYSASHLKNCARDALNTADAYGLTTVAAGRGIAEG